MVNGISENGILAQKDFEAFKARTVRLRFQQQISYGIGAAMVFGLVGALATQLFKLLPAVAELSFSAATIAPILGLAVIGVLGVGAIYMSAQYLSENTLLEQDLQAKKIGLATRGPGLGAEPAAPGTSGLPSMDTSEPTKQWVQQVAPNHETLQKTERWVDRATAEQSTPVTRA